MAKESKERFVLLNRGIKMLKLGALFGITLFVVFIIVLIINYITQTYLMYKNDHKINMK